MPRWEAPRGFRNEQATRAQIRDMSRMTVQRNRCPWCETVYATYEGSVKCDTWHRILFRQMRSDLMQAADKAERNGDPKQAKRLLNKLKDIPTG